MTKATKAKLEKMFEACEDTGEGFEGINMDTQAIPFMRILQLLSPQLAKTKPEYILEAEEGMIFNTVSEKLYTAPLRFVVGKFERYYVEWKPNRGGFVGTHLPETVEGEFGKELARDENYQLFSPSTGNKFVDTYIYYVVFPDFMEEGVCILSLSSSQIKEAKKLNRNMTNTMIPGTNKKAKPYFMVWVMDVVLVSNDKGEWYAPRFKLDSFVTQEALDYVVAERKALPNKSVDLSLLGEDAGKSVEQTEENVNY